MDEVQRFVCKYDGEIIPLLPESPPVPVKSLNPYVIGFAVVEYTDSIESITCKHFSFNEEGLNQLIGYLTENHVDECSFLRNNIEKQWDVDNITDIPICSAYSKSYPGSTLTLTYKPITENTFRDKIKTGYVL